MNDTIKVGLDFGTHQTKICVQTTPDEGHGEPKYEFFKFVDFDGNSSYFLPSVIQLNDDDTLSYGYVDPKREKHEIPYPQKEKVVYQDFDAEEECIKILQKYRCDRDSKDDISSIAKMLDIKRQKDYKKYQTNLFKAEEKYKEELREYKNRRCLYRYFKQATFTNHIWEKDIDENLLSIWYLSYVIFKLEEAYGTNFSINMGVPADDETFEEKKEKAFRILASAYKLVETVYENDISKFLGEKINDLMKKTEYVSYSSTLREEFYYISVFPEAYASLITLTLKGKLTDGMSITVDIGGGTTDISFFVVNGKTPLIYRYWSIPKGLNYIAEESGFDYSEGDFYNQSSDDIINKYNDNKQEIVSDLVLKLIKDVSLKKGISKRNLFSSLEGRVVVYAGGGSIYDGLATPIHYFTEVHRIGHNMWREEQIIDKSTVQDACYLLTIAFGLSLAKDENDVQLCSIDEFLGDINKTKDDEPRDKYIDKDVC